MKAVQLFRRVLIGLSAAAAAIVLIIPAAVYTVFQFFTATAFARVMSRRNGAADWGASQPRPA